MARLGNIFLLALVLVAGCSSSYPSYITAEDRANLQFLREAWSNPKNEMDPFLVDLVNNNPRKLAEEAARKGDYKLIGLEGRPIEKVDVKPLAVECRTAVKTQNVISGCIPFPEVVYKLMLEYNSAVLQQPGFPKDSGCKLINKQVESLKNIKF